MYSAIRLNPKFLENIVILCFDSRFSKQIRIKSYTLVPPKNFGPPQILGLAAITRAIRNYSWLRKLLYFR